MDRNGETADGPTSNTSLSPGRRALRYALIIIFLTFVINSLEIPAIVDRLINTFVSTVSPVYSTERQLQIALRLTQVAVLYFGGLAGVFRFINVPSSPDTEVNQSIFYVFVLAIFLVSISALSSVVTILDIFPEIALLVALLSMLFAFFLAIMSSVLVLLRNIEITARRDPDGISEQKQPDSGESNTSSGRSDVDDDDRSDTDARDIDTVQSDTDQNTVSSEQSATTREDSDTGAGHRDDGRIRRWGRDKE